MKYQSAGTLDSEKLHTLDARGLLCPLPIVRLQQAVKKVAVGEEIMIVATDPGVLEDIPAWCRINSHKHLSSVVKEDEYLVKIAVAS